MKKMVAIHCPKCMLEVVVEGDIKGLYCTSVSDFKCPVCDKKKS